MTASDNRILAVKVIHQTFSCTLFNGCLRGYAAMSGGMFTSDRDLPPGNWKLIGLHSKDKPLSEEQCKELVLSSYLYDHERWIDYTEYNFRTFECLDVFDTALQSLESWMRKQGIYMVNPYGEESPPRMYDTWKAAQERTGT